MRHFMNTRAMTVGILLLGLLIRVGVIIAVKDMPLKSDPASYHLMSQQLASNTLDDPYWPPGLPLYLAGVHKVFGDSESTSRWAMLAPYLLFSISFFLVLRRLAGTLMANIGLVHYCPVVI